MEQQHFQPAFGDDVHICLPQFAMLNGMRAFYAANGMLATSENADVALIRSHIAYHAGNNVAERAVIKSSRGHSYRINHNTIVRITDHYNHRTGVQGYC